MSFGVGVVVVVNCEGGVVMTGYDATTAERRGQVVRLLFSTHKYFLWKNGNENSLNEPTAPEAKTATITSQNAWTN